MIFALPQRQVWPFRVWMAQLNESMTEASKDVWKSYEIFGSQQKFIDWGLGFSAFHIHVNRLVEI